ncbi:MAG: Fe(3+) dicitrate transport protein [Flavobacteriales bacterium]|jgi:Fe(3+) dicitrate transport protein
MTKFLLSLLIVAASLNSWAQDTVTIQVYDQDSIALENVEITIDGSPKVHFTRANGKFKLTSLSGIHTFSIYKSGYKPEIEKVDLQDKQSVVIYLSTFEVVLGQAEIISAENRSQFSHLQAVEGTAVYRGMKSEVIYPNQGLANVSTNNTRQVYNKVAGLNIWETDGAGIQLGIGARGLSPNRTSHFNVRQNLYDISADPLGYPESYYTPPLEAVEKINLVRGAAALQYGPQFGGLLNFIMKKGNKNRALEVTLRQTIGSYGVQDTISPAIASSNTFLSLSGSRSNWTYYGFYQYKTGSGWRPNSGYDVHTGYLRTSWSKGEKLSIEADVTIMNYLAQQPGGLTDVHFNANPRQSFRDRNWFFVDWKLASFHLEYNFSKFTSLSSKTFGLLAQRSALGYLGQANRTDPLQERNLIDGKFRNWGNETRFLHKLFWKEKLVVFAGGLRYFQGTSHARQGMANSTNQASFEFIADEEIDGSSYSFPNQNVAIYTQEIIPLTKKLSATPGIRYEWIQTKADGQFRQTIRDGAGQIIEDTLLSANQSSKRDFILAGIGLTYKVNENIEIYSNWNQNYRAINFTDIQIKNAGTVVDPDIKDERGYTADIGARGHWGNYINFDISAFLLQYNDRIGSYFTTVPDPVIIEKAVRLRTNISKARNVGIEAFAETELLQFFGGNNELNKLTFFVNGAFTYGRYTDSEISAFYDKRVELIPMLTFKSGLQLYLNKFGASIQYSYTGEQFSDATNAVSTPNGVDGLIPAYHIFDYTVKYEVSKFQFSFSVNNLLNTSYFTRRAAGYPGPGIIPADGRGYYLTFQLNI